MENECSRKYPQPLAINVIYLEIVGALSLNRFKEKWQNRAMALYCLVSQILAIAVLASHVLSTVTRSIRYMPEFYQKLLEDLVFNMYYVEVLAYKYNYKRLAKLTKYMEEQFSLADLKIVETCVKLHKIMFYGSLLATTCVLSGSIVETYFPVSQKEIDLLRYVYKRKHPERLLQTNFWIPYIDDSESPYYEIIFITEFYLIYWIVIAGTVSMTSIPMLVEHMTGQYTMLSQSIQKLGNERQQDGTYIYYTNVETNEYFVQDHPLRGNRKEQYEQDFCHQLIRFHQKLLKFQDELHEFYSPSIFLKVIFSNIVFALCLYQLTLSSISMSKARLYKLTAEFAAFGFQYFYLCNYSDFLDDCNTMVERAVNNCGWQKCSRQTRRDLCMLLRRVQQPNHLRFYDGVIILNRYYFMRVVKVSYSMVNFMKVKGSPKEP